MTLAKRKGNKSSEGSPVSRIALLLGLTLVAIFFLIGPSVLPAAWAAQGPINGTNPGSTNNCTGSFFNNCGGTPTFNFPYFVIVIIIVIIGGVWAILTISRRA